MGYDNYVRVFINGELVDEVHNEITTVGRNWIGDRFRGRVGVSGIDTTNCYLAIGYSGGATTADMSALVDEAPIGSIGRTLIGSTYRDVTGSTIYITTWFYTSGGLGPIQELGLFGTGYASDEVTHKPVSVEAGSGLLIARAIKDVTNHNNGDNCSVEWRMTL